MIISKTRDVKTPTRGTEFSAGIDFYIPKDFDWYTKTIRPGESILIPSGIRCIVPKGHALIAFNKSGIATKKGLQVGACVIDEDYQGEIHIHLINVSKKKTYVSIGEKIVQFVLIPVVYTDIQLIEPSYFFVEESERGEGGFGSTGNS